VSDATDIIRQVIEDNLATQAIPNAASHIPVACEFLPSTIYTLKSKRYAAIPVVLRKEVADAVGFIVLRQVDPSLTPSAANATTPATMSFHTLRGPQDALKITVTDDPLGIATSDKDNEVAVSSGALKILDTAITRRRSPLTMSTKSPAKSGVAPSPTPLCTFDATLESKATKILKYCVATQTTARRELGCATGLLIRDAVQGENSALPGDARRLLAALVFELRLQKQPANTNSGTATIGGEATRLVEALTAFVLALAKGEAPDAVAADTCTAAQFSGPDLDACKKDVSSALKFIETAQLNVASLEQGLRVANSVASSLCPPDSSSASDGTSSVVSGSELKEVCSIVRDVTSGGVAIIDDVEKHNYGEAAGAVVDTVENIQCDDIKAAGCKDIDKKVYAFLKALAIYSIDSATSSGPTATVDGAFRTAAIELIEAASGPGVRRSLVRKGEWAWVPELSLRESYMPGHIGTGSGQAVQYPSVEFIRGHLSLLPASSPFYFSLHGSLGDAIGPFVEAATKVSGLQTPASVFALGFFVPRGEIEFGLPDLTRNVVIGAGVALRLFRAEQLSTGAYAYCIVTDNNCSSSGNNGFNQDNFEFSVFVRYVP
jgi:hypothetical protein